ncbi:MAG TPA: ABC transporter ATP-binding protein, partial [Clostridiales bacterium]|nr:ABC transporter ATP-binding protein [Clostridiales bacterium]
MGLHIKNMIKSFGSNIAVNDISFSMEKPGVFGLIGTNGAGKTTCIRTILGIMSADSGKAEWNEKKISRENLSFGYMPEERGIYMKTKVLEQLVYFGTLRGMSKTDAKKSALDYMERLGVSEYRDVPAEKLSKGNQQKVQLITTLIHNPELIFLDEPFSGLDPVNTNTLNNLIHELVLEKRFVVMSSHQMSTVEEYCEDIL